MKDEMEIRHRCFMDGIDWQHHLSGDAFGTELFPSESALRDKKTCLSGGCGVVEVEVRLIRWVEKQDLKYGESIEMAKPYDRPTDGNPGGCECMKCGVIFTGAEHHEFCGVCIEIVAKEIAAAQGNPALSNDGERQ